MASIDYTAATSTALAQNDIQQAKAAIVTYCDSCAAAFAKLKGTVEDLKTSGAFIGDASDGFTDFFSAVTPALSTNLYGETEVSLMYGLKQILDGIEQVLMQQEDPGLKQANEQAAGNTAAAAPAAV